ncbi:fasciclin domain-containing protein [Sphingobacterium sp. SYP-B4668]|uniref:fasciclin domain-containing protein n=1 Tax=Sphingobacterium sp. SYP-B4668 TaxID=2996035 RepID=UPI000532614E|nr:fasciclin domain-containing protein [Sphingobacterium sp. SYP-B4668]
MMTILNKVLGLACLLIGLASCQKGDQYYFDYKNETKTFDGTILDYLDSQPGVFDSLILTLDRVAELRTALKDDSKQYTLFAVTNRSFEIAIKSLNTTRKLANKKPLYIEDLDLIEVDSILSRYVFQGMYDTDYLSPFVEGQTIESVRYNYKMHMQYEVTNASGLVGGGQQQIELSDVNNSIFQRYWKSINTASVNLKTKNGVIHILSSGHDFGFNKLTTKFAQ